ncbi:unnamed protein product [Closterium sp. Naga37s-1]|nr:unnamed protein product [Closterium sp. Naga37s-1]
MPSGAMSSPSKKDLMSDSVALNGSPRSLTTWLLALPFNNARESECGMRRRGETANEAAAKQAVIPSDSESLRFVLSSSSSLNLKALEAKAIPRLCCLLVLLIRDPSEYRTGVKRNHNIGKLQAGYLFPEIARRRRAHLEKHPDAKIISLGIGDTTEPIPDVITAAMAKRAQGLSTPAGYSGYGAEQGEQALRAAICATWYSKLGITEDEVFVSDGAKCDIARLQMMFGADVTMACQDPSYPAYVDTSVMMGQTGLYVPETQQFGNVTYLRCTPENDFFPDLASAPRTDIIFFCSPNNPTGRAASRQQLQQLVDFARTNGSIIVYDCAYAIYIEDDSPKSIYEIPGADEVAIETGSFSKYAGFTGVRLGWSVVPAALRYADGHPVRADFNRVTCTCFNGASNVSQAGGLACLSPEGLEAMALLVSFYKENAAILKSTFQSLGFETHGGDNAPYVWVRFPGRSSWDVFAEILEKADIVTTPGSGFGPGGEGFVRASAFGNRANIEEAARRITKLYSS